LLFSWELFTHARTAVAAAAATTSLWVSAAAGAPKVIAAEAVDSESATPAGTRVSAHETERGSDAGMRHIRGVRGSSSCPASLNLHLRRASLHHSRWL